MENPVAQQPLCILYAEDDMMDRELVARAMRRDGLQCEFLYAATEEQIRNCLSNSALDLILSDFRLRGLDGNAVLRMAKEMRPDVPFVFFSGTIGEERAVETLKAGATDYLLKDHLHRLGSVVRRALREAHDRARHYQVQHQLQLLRSLIDHTSDAIEIIDPKTGRFLDVNEQACAALGYTREEYLNLTLPDVAPQLVAREWDQVSQELRRSGSRIIEAQHRRKDGSVFPIEISVNYIHLDRDYLFAVVRDITERKKAEERLRAGEERFRMLAETIEDVFWITDTAKDRMVYISPAYEKIWGRSCRSLYEAPRSWLDAVHPGDRPRVLDAARTKQANGSYDEEYRICRPDGQVRWVRDRAFPVRDDRGEIEMVVGVARDITERRELEEQLRQSQKMEAIGQLAGGTAHDFNNILSVIMMQSQLAAMIQNTPPEVQQGLQQILAAAERAASLTRQLLLFSRKQVMQLQNLDLNAIVISLARMLRRLIGEDIDLQIQLHKAPLRTHADAGMVDQVILNLAVNARDAMPAGGRLLIETAEKVVDEAMARVNPEVRPGRYVWLGVSDTGTGIAPEILPRIFEPFFTTKDPGKGTGLGLATVYGIVKQHQGWVQVHSRPGQGTTFQIFLPACAAPGSVPEAPVSRPKPRGGTETILLVEDEEALRLVTRVLLERYGYRVLEAENGVKAIATWLKHREQIALLLTDLVMPAGLSGQQLASRLHRDNPKLKIIFTSGYSAEIAGRHLQLRTGENFVQKPCPPEQLLETIRRSLDTL